VQALAFSPDGQTLAAGTSAGSVFFWHVPSWQELGRFKTPLAAINDLVFSAEGNTLAIGGRTIGGAGKVLLWETKPNED
jgi:WD40 repeat protein